MSITRFAAISAVCWCLATLAGSSPFDSPANAQGGGTRSVQFKVSGASQKLEMTVGTTRILTVEHDVPKLLVQNTEVIQATPLSANQIQINALKPGFTAINLWDEKNNISAIDVRVIGDIRELQDNLEREFPSATIKLRPTNASLVISGYAPRAEMVSDIIRISEDYYPKVINRLSVGGQQQVLLHVKVMEVSRTKLRRLGIDWGVVSNGDFVIQSVSGLLNSANSISPTASSTIRFGIVNNAQFGMFFNVLRQNNLAKILAEPTLVATSGRAASFNSGGEIPITISNGLNGNSVQFREFGTTVDFVPIVLGDGRIKLEVRPQITEIDRSLADASGTPGFRSRRVDTGVEMRAGQTLALAGLIQNRTDAVTVGLPWLSDLPWVGAAFRRIEETSNEVELLIMVTPELVAPLERHEVPPCGPGQSTASPNDVDLYFRGYLEVPRCCTDGSCPQCRGKGPMGPIGPTGPGPLYEDVQPSAPQGADAEETRAPIVPGRSNQYRTNADYSYQRREYPRAVGSGATQATPVSRTRPTTQGRQYNQYEPSNPTVNGGENKNSVQETQPNLIGPIGYEVLN